MGNVLTVGTGYGYEYATIAAAVGAAKAGDTIDVKAGTYTNDTTTIDVPITLQAVGGQVVLRETQALPNEKGILVTNADATIEGFTFEGAAVSNADGGNGAGIRYQAGNLKLVDDLFENNQDGVLATPNVNGTGTVDVEGSEFINNGSGTGYTHNIYVNDVATFIFNDSYSAAAVAGHDIKSRAATNIITNSRIQDNSGTTSYEIDLPNGGEGVVANDLIQQGVNSANHIIVSDGEEGNLYADSSLTMTNNRIINDVTSSAVMVANDTATKATLAGNATWGLSANELSTGPVQISGETQLAARPTAALSAAWTAPAIDDPAIAAMPASVSVPKGSLGAPLAGVTLSDAGHATATVEAIVTLSAPVGTLSGAGGVAGSDGLTWVSAAGTLATVQSELDGVVFSAGANDGGKSAQLCVTLVDANGGSATATAAITTGNIAAPVKMDFVAFSTGNDTVSAPAQNLPDVFVETGAVIGNDIIKGFDAVSDILQLSRTAFASVAAVLKATTTTSGNAVIRLDAHDSITLPGVASGALNTHDVQLV